MADRAEQTPWSSTDTLFITWVGINDCAHFKQDFTENMEALFIAQHELYEAGARNFCFIDVPPIHRSPAGNSSRMDASVNYVNWNSQLTENVSTFIASHPDVTVLVFSSWATFTRVLDNPTAYGFNEEDRAKKGAIWVDRLHPTSRMHDIIAADLSAFLMAHPASPKTSAEL